MLTNASKSLASHSSYRLRLCHRSRGTATLFGFLAVSFFAQLSLGFQTVPGALRAMSFVRNGPIFAPYDKLKNGRYVQSGRECQSQTLPAPVSMATDDDSVASQQSKSDEIDITALDNPDGCDPEIFKESLELYKRMRACKIPTLAPKLQKALDVLDDAYRLYGTQRVFASYNGGKDAVAVAHLARAAAAAAAAREGRLRRPRMIYFAHAREFPEVLALIEATEAQYGLEVIRYDVGFVQGLTRQVAAEGGAPCAFALGTRRGDPNCGAQGHFAPSSAWMPPFMRVNPVLDWDYGQVWEFLRAFELPYPALYDRGFTSLGKMDDTFPNPALRREDGSYLPAYLLSDWTQERAGRGSGGAQAPASLDCDLDELDARRRRVARARHAGLIIIGDEILKGKTPDTNTAFAMARLSEIGIPLKRIAVVSDDFAEIEDEVRRQVQACDVVVTSGGLGPTHDDVTLRAAAAALGQRLAENGQMVRKLMAAYGAATPADLSPAQRKMALLPELAKLRLPEGDPDAWPILQCENVFILPGVPQFFEKKMDIITSNFLKPRFQAGKKIVLRCEETSIVDTLNNAVKQYPGVAFGSYPFYGRPDFSTVLTLEGSDLDELDAATNLLLSGIPKDDVVKVREDSTTLLSDIEDADDQEGGYSDGKESTVFDEESSEETTSSAAV